MIRKTKTDIKAISLFSGCGGADLGLMGGFNYLNKRYPRNPVQIVHASDICSKATKTYNANFKGKAIIRDINDIKFRKNDADVVIGGFPCQAFSTVNPTKIPNQKDKQLFWQMANVVSDVKPKVLIAENVKGFYRLSNGKYFDLAKSEFEKQGYKIYHQLINASNFGIPQKRERQFIIGVKKNIKRTFKFPLPKYGPESRSKNPKIALKEVIESLEPGDEKYYFSKRAVEGVKKAKPNMKRAVYQDLDGQCLTITSHLAKVSLNSRDPVLLVDPKKELYRRFTPREAARIQSFPEDFIFKGSEGDAYRQIGNAVPPVLMWYIFRSIYDQVLKAA